MLAQPPGLLCWVKHYALCPPIPSHCPSKLYIHLFKGFNINDVANYKLNWQPHQVLPWAFLNPLGSVNAERSVQEKKLED